MCLFYAVNDAVVQADEVDGRYLQFEGGLSVTSNIVSGIYSLAQAASKPAVMTNVSWMVRTHSRRYHLRCQSGIDISEMYVERLTKASITLFEFRISDKLGEVFTTTNASFPRTKHSSSPTTSSTACRFRL